MKLSYKKKITCQTEYSNILFVFAKYQKDFFRIHFL